MTTQLYDPLTYENLMLGLTMRFEQQPAASTAEGLEWRWPHGDCRPTEGVVAA